MLWFNNSSWFMRVHKDTHLDKIIVFCNLSCVTYTQRKAQLLLFVVQDVTVNFKAIWQMRMWPRCRKNWLQQNCDLETPAHSYIFCLRKWRTQSVKADSSVRFHLFWSVWPFMDTRLYLLTTLSHWLCWKIKHRQRTYEGSLHASYVCS